ncbi:hypothetical protein [Streptomyces sp. NPDC094032]|uniref:hypothetical protein n=1 Tax=Streptomyces sp. NPDC094032 TaxID=3155308 RepID=UPI00332C3373
MADLLALGLLGLLLLGAATLAAALVCATVAAGRALRRRPVPEPLPAAELPAPRLFVWLACHTPRCGHLETAHYPAGPGYVMCDQCGTHRRAPSS